jgi:perosamine synthetase
VALQPGCGLLLQIVGRNPALRREFQLSAAFGEGLPDLDGAAFAGVSQMSVAGSAGKYLPYGRHSVSEEDIESVVEALRSDWLTTGPTVGRFERAVARYVGAQDAVALSSGTAALHAAMFALGIGPGDEVIVPAMTFAATANCVVFEGATPVFADVDPETLLVDAGALEALIGPRTRAIITVDYAGQPCDYGAIGAVARRYGLPLVADASHSLGAAERDVAVGKLADLSAFSLHPVKPMTTGEGGMVTTDWSLLAERMRRFRNHGIDRDHHQRSGTGSWKYEVTELGYNYRLTDFQSALGISQLKRLDGWIARRQQLAVMYDRFLADLPGVRPLGVRPALRHAWHLYVVRVEREVLGADRAEVYRACRAAGIGVGVHYLPVHLHKFYQDRFGTRPGLCPVAEAAYEEILSLPIFPTMSREDVCYVIEALEQVAARGHA